MFGVEKGVGFEFLEGTLEVVGAGTDIVLEVQGGIPENRQAVVGGEQRAVGLESVVADSDAIGLDVAGISVDVLDGRGDGIVTTAVVARHFDPVESTDMIELAGEVGLIHHVLGHVTREGEGAELVGVGRRPGADGEVELGDGDTGVGIFGSAEGVVYLFEVADVRDLVVGPGCGLARNEVDGVRLVRSVVVAVGPGGTVGGRSRIGRDLVNGTHARGEGEED